VTSAAETPSPVKIAPFERGRFARGDRLKRIGRGALGGKGQGLLDAQDILRDVIEAEVATGVRLEVPFTTILGADVFEAFVERNRLWRVIEDADDPERLQRAFARASLPAEIVGDLMAICTETQGRPMAVRSSSLLEDALEHPFAGVYATKMTPNHQLDLDQRFRRLSEAIKCVYASCFSAEARAYRAAIGVGDDEERMAVVLQEVIGERHGDRFYPDVSVVARSFAAYRFGRAAPEDGLVNLAAGLGKTIVDGDKCWIYSPAHPRAPAPVASVRDLLEVTQTELWAVDMSRDGHFDPMSEDEHLVRVPLATAEADGVLERLASTYDPTRDRVVPGIRAAGPRVLDFATILQMREPPLNDGIRVALRTLAEALGEAVELELAARVPPYGAGPAQLVLLQVRPMRAAKDHVQVPDFDAPGTLVASEDVLGQGHLTHIEDVVYLRPEAFALEKSRAIADELARVNRTFVASRRDYALLGFGRWGSSDPWLGVPVRWADISRARVIVESHGGRLHIDPSQGAHFFHNLLSFGVCYFTVTSGRPGDVDWAFLDALPATYESDLVRVVHLCSPLEVWADPRSGRGAIQHGDAA